MTAKWRFSDRAYDIVMLVLNDVQHDGRVIREARALHGAGWRVAVVGTLRPESDLPTYENWDGIDVWRVRYQFGGGLWWPWRWLRHGLQALQVIRALIPMPARAFHAHDLPALMLMTVARWFRDGATSIVYDAHELFLFQPPRGRRLADFWTRTTRPIFLALERRLARQATAVVTVTEPLARWYAWKFRVPRPCVVRNALDPLLRDDTGPVDLRKIVEPTCAILVHTGIITNRGRSLSETVEALQYVPESVCLVFLGQGEHQEDLQETARKWGVSGRVFFVPPVLPDEVPETIRSADAALVLLRPDSVNTWGALPNKLFEAVAAGLPVVVSPTFALARVVVEHDLGPVCVGFGPQEIAAGIQAALSPEGQSRYRARVMAAQQKMNWQHEAAKLCQIYEGILR